MLRQLVPPPEQVSLAVTLQSLDQFRVGRHRDRFSARGKSTGILADRGLESTLPLRAQKSTLSPSYASPTPAGSFASAAAWSKLVREVREQGPPRLQPLDHRERLVEREMGGMRLGPEGIEDQRVQALEQAPALVREFD